ncbi:MAG TPA: hypothetical protein VFD73_05645 [Gemmatimonadales bacterium]|nr:hypothetical protein [Gemmatimonadales bacterium]
MLSIAFDNRTFGWLAIAALAVAVLVRLITRSRVAAEGDEQV